MTLFKSVILLTISFMYHITTATTRLDHYTVQGIVINKQNGQPLPNIYIYAVKGEEEAVSDAKGRFRFESWQKLPLTIFVQYGENENIRAIISNPKELITIKI